jgi:hypothetical protein
MGFVASLFNGDKGAGFTAQSADIAQQAELPGQTSQAITNTQYALNNQSNQVQQNQALQQALTNQNQRVYGQQQGLADQLALQAQGGGPNPALDQLQQTTDANNRQAAGLVASTKGINPALAARMAAQNSAMSNQQAGGQAAIQRANQQLASQQLLGQQTGQMIGQQFQGQNMANQATQAQTSAQLAQQQALQSALQGQNQLAVQNASQKNSSNAAIAGINAKQQGDMFNSAMSGLGGGLTEMMPKGGAAQAGLGAMMASGGKVPGKASVEGDSYSNDTVPAILSPGEIVIPRSASKDPEKAKAFIDHIMNSKAKGYARVLQSRRK